MLHPLPTRDGAHQTVQVERVGERCFRLSPSPFPADEMEFSVRSRFVPGERFGSDAELGERFHAAPVQEVPIRLLT